MQFPVHQIKCLASRKRTTLIITRSAWLHKMLSWLPFWEAVVPKQHHLKLLVSFNLFGCALWEQSLNLLQVVRLNCNFISTMINAFSIKAKFKSFEETTSEEMFLKETSLTSSKSKFNVISQMEFHTNWLLFAVVTR